MGANTTKNAKIIAFGQGSLQFSPGYTGMMSKANCSMIDTMTYTKAKATEKTQWHSPTGFEVTNRFKIM